MASKNDKDISSSFDELIQMNENKKANDIPHPSIKRDRGQSTYFTKSVFSNTFLILLLQAALRTCNADEVLPIVPEPLSIPTGRPTIFMGFPISLDPTPFPSSQPSAFSTTRPTAIPSEFPSDKPSLSPSLLPSVVLSETPTGVPSNSPSVLSSTVPSGLPSTTPSTLPTLIPTVLSSTEPTLAPSSLPSISSVPSLTPTFNPSMRPSFVPSLQPSSKPSLRPSTIPSTPPSSSPTLQLQTEEVNFLIMEFDDCPFLDGENIDIWKNVTSEFIQKEIESLDLDIIQLDVKLTLNRQCLEPKNKCDRRLTPTEDLVLNDKKKSKQNPLRRLQSKQPLTLFFSIDNDFRSPRYNHTFTRYVIGAFDSNNDQLDYIKILQDNGDVFGPINTMRTTIDGTDSGDIETGMSRQTLVIYASCGAVALFLVGVTIFVCVERKRKRLRKNSRKRTSNPIPIIRDYDHESSVGAAFVNINPNVYDDISTIGDPTIYSQGIKFAAAKHPGDQDSASNSTYDYANVYGGTGEAYSVSSAGAETNMSRFTSVDSDASKMRNSAMTPEISRKEERFEVRAPPGKLGMVIDTPNNGPPLVHAIRENSVMSTKVRMGDRLISVDGEDATRMDATKVSRMISSRVNNPVRLLVFTRG